MKRFSFLYIALCFAMLTLSPPRANAASSHPVAAQHTATPSDAQIDATIRTKLAKSKIGKDGFRFHVQRGVVTWEGSTNVVQHKGSATRMARAAGAVQVVNNIQISSLAKTKAVANLKRATVQ